MLKGMLLIAGAGAVAAAASKHQSVRELTGRLMPHETDDPTIARVPATRMPVTAQATIAPKTFEPGEQPREEAAEGRGAPEGRGPSGEARD
jgi:hypothetical protein